MLIDAHWLHTIARSTSGPTEVMSDLEVIDLAAVDLDFDFKVLDEANFVALGGDFLGLPGNLLLPIGVFCLTNSLEGGFFSSSLLPLYSIL